MPSKTPDRQHHTSASKTSKAAVGAADAELLARIQRGDRIAFATLLETHLPAVVRIANSVLRDFAEAEDVAQDVCLKIWNAPEKVHCGPSGVMTWIYRATVNQAIDRQRQRQRRRTDVTDTPPDQVVTPVQLSGMEEQDLSIRVDAALSTLPERQAVALQLFHFEGLTQAEVADALTCSAEAVESLLSRARKALRAELEEDWRTLLPDLDPETTPPPPTGLFS